MDPFRDKCIFDLGQEVKEGCFTEFMTFVRGGGGGIFENLNVPFVKQLALQI